MAEESITYMGAKVGDPLSRREQQAVDLFDAGKTDTQIADEFEMTGSGRSGNAGNFRRRGLWKQGRYDPYKNGGSSAPRKVASKVSMPKRPDREEELLESISEQRAARVKVSGRLNELTADLNKDDEAIIADEVERLQAAVDAAQELLDLFQQMPEDQQEQFAADFRNTAQAAHDAEHENLETSLKELDESIEEDETLLEVLQARREKKEQALIEEAEAAMAKANEEAAAETPNAEASEETEPQTAE